MTRHQQPLPAPAEMVLARSRHRVLAHCRELLARNDTTAEERSRLLAIVKETEREHAESSGLR
jgi:hypothetical protein